MNNYTVINVRNKSTYTIINVRNITIIRVTYLQAATVCRLSCKPLPEELLEEHLAEQPILPIDTVFHLVSLDSALYQSRFFEGSEVLTDGRFGDGQFFFYMPEIALAALRQKLHHRYPSRMSEGFGKLRQLLLFEGVVLHEIIAFVYRFFEIVRKSTNNNWNTQITSQKNAFLLPIPLRRYYFSPS